MLENKKSYVAPIVEVTEFSPEESIAVSGQTRGAVFFEELT